MAVAVQKKLEGTTQRCNNWAKRIIDAKVEKPIWQDNQNDSKDKDHQVRG